MGSPSSPEAPLTAGASHVPTGPSTRRPFGFPRAARLTTGAELDAVRQQGKRVRTEHLELRVLAPSSASAPLVGAAAVARIGIIVPRHKHTAVDRNCLKRRLRELARTRLLPTLPPGHVVIRARPEAYAASFDALARQIERAGRDVARLLSPVAP